tara:strand:- start:245 stop:436 length:192 start_codon:yes stop_codon:yes gene_type:complete
MAEADNSKGAGTQEREAAPSLFGRWCDVCEDRTPINSNTKKDDGSVTCKDCGKKLLPQKGGWQ